MTLLVALLLVVGSTTAALNHDGAKCGEKHCSTIEYCSSYDKSCKPCSSICNKTARNYLPQECFSDCQGEQQGDNFSPSLLETRSNRYKRFGIDRGKGQVTARSLAPEYIREGSSPLTLHLTTVPPSTSPHATNHDDSSDLPTCLPAFFSFLVLASSPFLFFARQPASHPHPASPLTARATVPFENVPFEVIRKYVLSLPRKIFFFVLILRFFSFLWISVYLHDERYVLLNEYEELRGKWNLLNVICILNEYRLHW